MIRSILLIFIIGINTVLAQNNENSAELSEIENSVWSTCDYGDPSEVTGKGFSYRVWCNELIFKKGGQLSIKSTLNTIVLNDSLENWSELRLEYILDKDLKWRILTGIDSDKGKWEVFGDVMILDFSRVKSIDSHADVYVRDKVIACKFNQDKLECTDDVLERIIVYKK